MPANRAATWLTFLGLLLASVASFAEAPDDASPDPPPAPSPDHPPLITKPLADILKEARQTGQPIMVAFLGTGWSVASKRFRQNILQSGEFSDFIKDNLLYWPVHARRQPPLSKKERAVLQSLVIHFDIQSYPTFILLDPDGNERLRHGYRDFSAAEYCQLLQQVIPSPR